jgi:hypothetical protein
MDAKFSRIDPSRCKLIACATVIEEMRPVLPYGITSETLEFGLHADPEQLNRALQRVIDSSDHSIDTILLGYGLCSRAVVGLKSDASTIVVPRVDDCIAIFLGSPEEYSRQHQKSPGTIYLTKGWLEGGKSPLEGHPDMIKRYGETRAKSLLKQMFKNYTRLVFIDTGNYKLEHYRTRSKSMAKDLNLQFEEIKGSDSIITRLLFGPWDDNFLVIPPGRKISFLDFRKS